MDESTNGEWFSYCGVGLISIVVFSIPPAISASYRFHCAHFIITQNGLGEGVLVF